MRNVIDSWLTSVLRESSFLHMFRKNYWILVISKSKNCPVLIFKSHQWLFPLVSSLLPIFFNELYQV